MQQAKIQRPASVTGEKWENPRGRNTFPGDYD